MRITIHYMAQLRRAAGTDEETLDVADHCTVAELLLRLADARGAAFAGLVAVGPGKLQPSLLVFVEDEQVRGERPLRDGDRITLLTPMAGG